MLSLHLIAASITSTPEIALEEKEAAALAEAIAAVASHYDVPGLDEGPAAIVMLCVTALGIYGKRVVQVKVRKSKPAKKRDENAEAENVVPLSGNVVPGSLFGLGAA